MRREFGLHLFSAAKKNKNIVLLVGDLGYGLWDQFREELPDQFFNVGAAEQTMLDMAVGMSYEGKIPFCYSITPFLLARPYEVLRVYINPERLHINLVGSGRENDYAHDGPTHFAGDDLSILRSFKNIQAIIPEDTKNLAQQLQDMIQQKWPHYINLKR